MGKYIDADAAMDAIRELDRLVNNEEEGYLLALAVENVRDVPAADVETVRHGKWLNSHHTQIVTCSLCGGTVQTNWRGFYCQNCGARMDGGAGDEPDA